MMNNSNSPAQAGLRLPSSLPNWAKGPLQSECWEQNPGRHSWSSAPQFFFLLSTAWQQAERKREKGWAFMISLMSLGQENDQQQEIIAKVNQSHMPMASL